MNRSNRFPKCKHVSIRGNLLSGNPRSRNRKPSRCPPKPVVWRHGRTATYDSETNRTLSPDLAVRRQPATSPGHLPRLGIPSIVTEPNLAVPFTSPPEGAALPYVRARFVTWALAAGVRVLFPRLRVICSSARPPIPGASENPTQHNQVVKEQLSTYYIVHRSRFFNMR